MSNVTVLFTGNDTVVEVKGLKGEVTGLPMNAATVTATLVDETGTQVTGQSWPVSLSYVTGSDGNYRATLSHLLAITAGGKYTLNITADGGAGLLASWGIDCVARHRT